MGGPKVWQDVRVSLGPDAEVTGKLSFVSPTRIEGKLKGEVRSSDLLIIGPEAVVQATVHAEKLVVLGEVRGEVLGASLVPVWCGLAAGVALVFAAAVGVFFGYYPARKAAALNPIEALRYE